MLSRTINSPRLVQPCRFHVLYGRGLADSFEVIVEGRDAQRYLASQLNNVEPLPAGCMDATQRLATKQPQNSACFSALA
jgi:hypothetical protein